MLEHSPALTQEIQIAHQDPRYLRLMRPPLGCPKQAHRVWRQLAKPWDIPPNHQHVADHLGRLAWPLKAIATFKGDPVAFRQQSLNNQWRRLQQDPAAHSATDMLAHYQDLWGPANAEQLCYPLHPATIRAVAVAPTLFEFVRQSLARHMLTAYGRTELDYDFRIMFEQPQADAPQHNPITPLAEPIRAAHILIGRCVQPWDEYLIRDKLGVLAMPAGEPPTSLPQYLYA